MQASFFHGRILASAAPARAYEAASQSKRNGLRVWRNWLGTYGSAPEHRSAGVVGRQSSPNGAVSSLALKHPALGHLKPGSTLVDVSLQEAATSATEASADQEGAESGAFVLATLGGDVVSNRSFISGGGAWC